MNNIRKLLDAEGILKRAAKVRSGWSASERQRRMGLPPDLPSNLRRQLVGLQSSTRRYVTSRAKRQIHVPTAMSMN